MKLITVVCFYGESIIEKECLMMLPLFDRHRTRNTTLGFSDPCFPHWMWFNFFFSAGLSPRSSHDTSLTSRASSAEGAPAHLTPFSTKRMEREFERKLQEVFVSVQLEKVQERSLFSLGLPTEGRKAKVLFNFKISNSKRHCDKGLDKVRTTLYSIPNSSKGKHCLIAFIEWSQFRISSTYSKVRTTFCSVINSTTGKYCSVAFI